MAVQLGCDTKEGMDFRCQCDERLTFPSIDKVNKEVRELLRSMGYIVADGEVARVERCYWRNAESWGEWEPIGEMHTYIKYAFDDELHLTTLINLRDLGKEISLYSAENEELNFEEYLASRANSRDTKVTIEGWLGAKATSKKEKQVWVKMRCVVTISIQSSWEYQLKSHAVRSKNQWCCKFCHGVWKGGREGTQQLTISWPGYQIQLIVAQPPDAIYQAWCKYRMEYHARVEPKEPPHDESPVIPRRHAVGTDRLFSRVQNLT